MRIDIHRLTRVYIHRYEKYIRKERLDMPNWCDVNISIDGKTNKILLLYNELLEATSHDRKENGFGPRWLGNIVEYCGMSWEDVSCRGMIVDMDMSENPPYLSIYLDTAWYPQMNPILILIDKLGIWDDINFTYLAIEPGCEVYCSNDPEYIGKYIVDVYDQSIVPEHFKKYDYDFLEPYELKNVLMKSLDKKDINDDISLNDLIRIFNETYDYSVGIHEIEYVDEHDF